MSRMANYVNNDIVTTNIVTNAPRISFTVQNLAGRVKTFVIPNNIPVLWLKRLIITSGLIDGNVRNIYKIKLFKAGNNAPVIFTMGANSLEEAGIEEGDELHAFIEQPHSGGKRLRCKSHRRRKSRGKKSRKH